ncbi:MAG: alkaline phosphatase family protein [Deltaproteobacteria bacterium]|nr:alkaline phosphatase family protein [Deltaproteobacteria bacterium]
MSQKNKIFVIGIDGATFDVINPLLSAGRLPNFARLMKKGSYGTLRSTIPCLSPAAWTSFMTGTNPAKHGILDFFGRNRNDCGAIFFNASYRRIETVWSMASRLGRKAIVINVPMTFPPEKVNGVMIAGMDTPDRHSNFMHPSNLKHELDDAIGGYMLERGGIRNVMGNTDPGEIFEILENRFAATKHLMKNHDWDIFAVVFEATDRVQHNFWEGVKTGRESAETNLVVKVYEDLDRKVGEIAGSLGEDVTTIVMSDHGFGPINKAVRLNLWLAERGYLAFDRGFKPGNGSWSQAKESILNKVKRLVPNALKPKRSGAGEVKHSYQVLPGIDWERTRAYAFGGMGNIFINLKGRERMGVVEPGKEYDSLREELLNGLKGLKDPENNRKMLSNVHRKEDAYGKDFADDAPDILVEWSFGYSFIGEKERHVLRIDEKSDRGFFSMHRWKGNHLPNGIFIINGRNIRPGNEVKDARIIDIAPTILYLMGIPVPGYMDGKVLVDSMDPDFLKSNEINYTDKDAGMSGGEAVEYTGAEEDAIKSKLKGLGYIE